MSQRTLFEVQTRFFNDTWENCWTEGDADINNPDGTPLVFLTHDLAMAAIYEFFADLHRSQMAHHYDFDDYRVRVVDTGAVNG